MSNDTANRTGRTNGASPMGSTVAIVITVVAVVLGIFILRKVNDTGGTSTANTNTTAAAVTTIDPTATTEAPVIVTTTSVGLIVEGTLLQVANASNQDGVAGQMSAVLATKGFTMAEAVSASEKLEVSKVLYNPNDPAAQAMAESLAVFFGGIEVVAQGMPVPVATGNWAEGSGVVLMLGNDFAGKTLDQIAGIPTTGTTAPPTTTG